MEKKESFEKIVLFFNPLTTNFPPKMWFVTVKSVFFGCHDTKINRPKFCWKRYYTYILERCNQIVSWNPQQLESSAIRVLNSYTRAIDNNIIEELDYLVQDIESLLRVLCFIGSNHQATARKTVTILGVACLAGCYG